MKNNKVKTFHKENPKLSAVNKKSIFLTRKERNLLKEVLL